MHKKIVYDFWFFFKFLALILDPVMHFIPWTSFRGIEQMMSSVFQNLTTETFLIQFLNMLLF